MKHVNPYRINDPDNIFEVGENSSHPELRDAKRLWKFKAYTFLSATELEKFFEAEGLNPSDYVLEPRMDRDVGHTKVIINVVEKSMSRNHQNLQRFTG